MPPRRHGVLTGRWLAHEVENAAAQVSFSGSCWPDCTTGKRRCPESTIRTGSVARQPRSRPGAGPATRTGLAAAAPNGGRREALRCERAWPRPWLRPAGAWRGGGLPFPATAQAQAGALAGAAGQEPEWLTRAGKPRWGPTAWRGHTSNQTPYVTYWCADLGVAVNMAQY